MAKKIEKKEDLSVLEAPELQARLNDKSAEKSTGNTLFPPAHRAD
jgi:hypothetical protein